MRGSYRYGAAATQELLARLQVNCWARWLSPIKLHFNHIRSYMQDHLAADTDDSDEQALIEVPEPKAWHVRFARYVSHVLAPAPLSLPFVLLVAFYHTRDELAALVYAFITLFFLSIGPRIYILIVVRLCKLSYVAGNLPTPPSTPFPLVIPPLLIL